MKASASAEVMWVDDFNFDVQNLKCIQGLLNKVHVWSDFWCLGGSGKDCSEVEGEDILKDILSER